MPPRRLDPHRITILPSHRVYTLRYPQHPVARTLPEPLKYYNLIAVAPGIAVALLFDVNFLENLFRFALSPVQDSTQARIAAKAWLRLTEEFHQNELFQCSIPDRSLMVSRGESGMKATGKAVVVLNGGNKGEIVVSLEFQLDSRPRIEILCRDPFIKFS